MKEMKMDPKKREGIITISIIAGMILIIGIVSALWAINENGKKKKREDIIYCYGADIMQKAEKSEYTERILDENSFNGDATLLVNELKVEIGVVPFLPSETMEMFGLMISDISIYTPLDKNGNELPEHKTAYVRTGEFSEEGNKETLIYVSKSNEMLIKSDVKAKNIELKTAEGKRSYINGRSFMLYNEIYMSMETSSYFAVFERGGHYWRIEFNNWQLDEVKTALTDYFMHD